MAVRNVQLIDGIDQRFIAVDGLTNGDVYNFEVEAQNICGVSNPSGEFRVRVGVAPEAPR